MWPENTMMAFHGAYDLGLRWMETDLHLSADGVVVCIHDDTLDRTTDASGPVSARTFAELRRIDATARHRGTGGDRVPEGIPAFEAAVEALEGTRWVVDLKEDGVERPLAELLGRRGWEDRVIVGSFSDRRLRLFRRLTGGRVATSTGTSETLAMWVCAIRGAVPRLRPAAVQVPRTHWGLPVVTKRSAAAFREAGAQVHVWTVDDPDEMRMLLGWGVEGIITDRPDVARRVFDDLGLW